MKYKIGIVEDDIKIAELLKAHLKKYGFEIWICNDFTNVAEHVLKHHLQLLLLDINLPCYDGFFWCKKIRRHSTLPIIFLSARSMDLDQIYAIECGGDDYLTKPFSYDLVTAKINAHLRRSYGEYALQETKKVELEHVTINLETLKLEYHEQAISLTKNEKDILERLFRAYPNHVKRNELLQLLWDTDMFVEENTLNVNIGRARKRLRELECPLEIKAIRNVGYVLEKINDEKNH
jgi:Response regulators consisting of a CheY-like receiver domain and a winged-helix DNA-binding domain|nr:response regulator transcription factor [uncultured Schaedlerella sp.]